MRTSRFTAVHRFCAAVSVAGLGVLALLVLTTDLIRPGAETYVLLLAPGVVLGELLPLKIPRRGDDEEVTVATTFAFALVIVGGALPAVLAQSVASIVQDVIARKPLWRIVFNVGQYTLSLAAAAVVFRALDVDFPEAIPFAPDDLGALAAGGIAFYAVNTTIVGTAIALYQGTSLRGYFRSDLAFSISTSSVLLVLAPVVLAAIHLTAWLYPACLVAMAAIWQGARQAARSEHQATHDLLTGLANRARLHALAERAVEDGAPFALLLMDLNRFKEINDTLGHHYGDLLLREVGERLGHAVRDQDAVARLGGDEFVVLVGDLPEPDTARRVAERVHAALHQPFVVGELVLEVDASIGIARWPTDAEDVETLLQRADIAMYHAKQAHLPQAEYDPEHDHHSPARLALAAELRRALGDGELVAWYQPQADLAGSRIDGVEALVRWEHPSLGLLAPGAFIEVAESTGLIRGLTWRVLEIALEDRARWAAEGLDITVAVNLSARSLLDRQLPAEVARRLRATGTPADRLELEITESTIMADPAAATAILHELSSMGVHLAVDDFGTGYSSLAYLKQLPVDELKIDRSFVMGMDDDRDDELIVRSTIELGHNLGLRVVAEGVEGPEALNTLAALGCDGAQGYHLSRPVPADRLRSAVARAAGLLGPPRPATARHPAR